MELRELTEKTSEIFKIKKTSELSERLKEVCLENKKEYFKKFEELVGDLSVDWLQKIYQYHCADRKEKMQDYTPKSLASFMGQLAGTAETVIDMCAGSGALTIQKWNINQEQKFLLYEFDENVIPYLLFNMALRNIDCIVHRADVLQAEIFATYKITQGEKYGTCEEVKK